MFVDQENKVVVQVTIDGINICTRAKAEPVARGEGESPFIYETVLIDGDWEQVEKEYTSLGNALKGHTEYAEMIGEAEGAAKA